MFNRLTAHTQKEDKFTVAQCFWMNYLSQNVAMLQWSVLWTWMNVGSLNNNCTFQIMFESINYHIITNLTKLILLHYSVFIVCINHSSGLLSIRLLANSANGRRRRFHIDPRTKVTILYFYVKGDKKLLFLSMRSNFSFLRSIFQMQERLWAKAELTWRKQTVIPNDKHPSFIRQVSSKPD